MVTRIEEFISTVTDEELDAGAEPLERGQWVGLVSDGARPMPRFEGDH